MKETDIETVKNELIIEDSLKEFVLLKEICKRVEDSETIELIKELVRASQENGYIQGYEQACEFKDKRLTKN